MTTPSVRAVGSLASGTGDITVPLPTHAAGDVLCLFVACDTDTVAAPTGWSIAAKATVSGITGYVMLMDDYAAGASETDPDISDPGNHVAAVAVSVRDADIELYRASGCTTVGSGTTGRTPSFNTAVDDVFTLHLFAWSADDAGPIGSSPVNADLSSVSEIFDGGTVDGNGSGIYLVSALKASPGSVRQTECTWSTASNCAGVMVAFIPKRATAYAGVVRNKDGSAAPNGTDVIRIVDATQPDSVVTASITGGAGGYSALVRYDDHVYVPIYDDGTKRGAGESGVA